MKTINPFFLSAYRGPAHFCNRNTERDLLISNALNGINTTLLSIRRLGKTGLIHHSFHGLSKEKQAVCIYLDIYPTQKLDDFCGLLGTAALQSFPTKNGLARKFKEFIQSLRPTISFDPLTGQPEVSLETQAPEQSKQNLESLLHYLDRQGVKVIVAIDEFQQIMQYPEKNIEALLRSTIQRLKNVSFIFSGSQQDVLLQMFQEAKRPFFASTQALHLHPIKANDYQNFIQKQFKMQGKSISTEAAEFILQWTQLHTYYTQFVANRVFAKTRDTASLKLVQETCAEILEEHSTHFYQYRNLLTSIQWNLLVAIAKEEKVYQPTSKNMLNTYNIGTAANVQRALAALLHKDLIYQSSTDEGSFYAVYDCFLAKWLARKF